ncbi:hypothetical protein ACFV0D_03875 [Streptomyces sp. NPDC059556]|uniref:hypothetical protein n=1 Tax=Streptomyces sp. NPDC059556 TaxID=3346863 RepID=UPI0036D19893
MSSEAPTGTTGEVSTESTASFVEAPGEGTQREVAGGDGAAEVQPPVTTTEPTPYSAI